MPPNITRNISIPADIEVEFVSGLQQNLGGLGEISYPMTAPAVCNALNAAHGKRITTLPIANQLDS